MPKKNHNKNGSVTLKEVAAELGVSAMTVSRAVNNSPNVDVKTKKRILAKVKEMGYTPNLVAKSLVSSKTFTVGVVIPEISHSFFPDVVRGIEEVLDSKEYQILLTNTSDNFEKEKKVIQALKSKRVDGILISSSLTTDDFSFYEELINSGIPIVFFDRCIENLGASCIKVNDQAATQQITEHLIKLGYKKIGYLSGPKNVSIGKARFDGFNMAMIKNGLAIDEKLIVENGYNEKGGYDAMNELLMLPEKDRPRAIVAVNDPVAFGAMDAIKEANLRIPEDIAIVGFTNDIRAKLVTPPLTTVNQPAYDVGKKAASKLIATIQEKGDLVENVELITSLVIRESCGSQLKN